MNMDEARKLVLETLPELGKSPSLTAMVQHLGQKQQYRMGTDAQLILTAWYDLFLTGVLSWGHDLANPGMEHAHLTEHGRNTLAQASRDPANPKGYLAGFEAVLSKNSVARSYLEEGVRTYNAGCYKATAVMVGAAAEALILELRDTLVDRMNACSKPPSKQLQDWRTKVILDAVEAHLDGYKNAMPRELAERYSSYWSAFTGQLRMARNDAGHPKSVEPVTRDAVHSSLLIFPELARLAADLQTWTRSQPQD